jgi:cytochrome b6-f complex iron-sulfur subunit
MDRKEFLSLVGMGAAAAFCSACLAGCTPQDQFTGPTNVDFTLDLNAAANSALQVNGGYIYNNGVIVARTTGGKYVAVSAACTHAGTTVYYDPPSNEFHCPSHGSNFATDGSVVNGPAPSSLTRYTTTLTGSSLRVRS